MPYSKVIKEIQKKPQSTQLLIGTTKSYTITTCVIHAHVINLCRPGSYEMELDKMQKANGLLPVKTLKDARKVGPTRER